MVEQGIINGEIELGKDKLKLSGVKVVIQRQKEGLVGVFVVRKDGEKR